MPGSTTVAMVREHVAIAVSAEYLRLRNDDSWLGDLRISKSIIPPITTTISTSESLVSALYKGRGTFVDSIRLGVYTDSLCCLAAACPPTRIGWALQKVLL